MIVCTALVMMMSPFVGLLYSGLSSCKNGLSSYFICMVTYSVVAIQWVLFGYSLSFSENSGSSFIGNFEYGGLAGIGAQALPLTAPAIPAMLFAVYQMQFATITATLVLGSVVGRVRFLPALFFIFIWTTIVYDPIAYWTWGARGWLRNLSCLSTTAQGQTPCLVGILDFAGGGPVEICSGASALALALVIGPRKKHANAHNMLSVNLATAMLWFGWYGFNAGSALAASPRAGMAALTTTIAAAAGSLSWVLFDYARSKKLTSLGYCSGALAGLVAITPACGFVSPWASIVIGTLAGLFSNWICHAKVYLGYDDTMDCFGIHGASGFLGLILTGVFGSSWVASLDGTAIPGGGIDGHWIQVGYQTAGAVTVFFYAFIVTLVLAWGFSLVPSLALRSSVEDEAMGLDEAEMGEVTYDVQLNEVTHSVLASMNDKKEKDPLLGLPEVPSRPNTAIEIYSS
ncbi:hypothetical protein HDU91_006764 [Kappamyces sp. JEL0680]|nr:hypothetical protein HDU91_006764 [Kappamyces sp. JEL0680]